MIYYVSPGYYPFVRGGAENQAKIIVDQLQIKKIPHKVFTLNFGKKQQYLVKDKSKLKLLGFGKNKLLLISAIVQYIFTFKNKGSIFFFQQLTLFTFLLIVFTRSQNIYLRLSNSGELFDFNKVFGKKYKKWVLFILKKKIKTFISINEVIRFELNDLKIFNVKNLNNVVLNNVVTKKNDKFKLVIISRFKKHKNISFFERLYKNGLNEIIEVYGDKGDDKKNIENLISLYDKVYLKEKFIIKSAPFDNSRPVLIHPSYIEGTSNTILEALSFGVPVIANNIKQNSFLKNNGENGVFLINTQKPNLWLKKINQLKEDRNYYNKISNNGKSYVIDNHNLDNIFKNFISILNE